jgi:hypothetical protein
MRSDGDTRLPSPRASPAFQASFNEQIKHIIRKLHAAFVQPQQQQDELLCGMIEHQMIFARPIDQIPDFDRLVVRSRDDLGPVRGKRDRHDCVAVRVCLLAQRPQFACQTSQQSSVLAKEGRFEGCSALESQTLIVLSSDPDTILVPSGENATELMHLLWALVFSLSSSSAPARQASRRQFWPSRGDFELAAHPNPRL